MAFFDSLSFLSRLSKRKADMLGQLAAINKALAVIEFTLDGKIIKGGSGVWGAISMPPNTMVSPAEAKTLATWILSIK